MSKTVALQESWGQEHDTAIYCPMCGAEIQPQAGAMPTHTAAQVLMRIGLMLQDHPIGTDTLILRSLFGWTMDQIGRRHGITRQRVHKHLESLREQYPEMASAIGRLQQARGG